MKDRTEKEILEEQKRQTDREKNDLCKVLSFPEGRRFIWGILCEARPFQSPYSGSNNELTFCNIGRGDMGRVLFNRIIAAKPEAFLQMQREALSEQNSKKNEDSGAADGL